MIREDDSLLRDSWLSFLCYLATPHSLGAFMFLIGSLYLQFIFDFLTFCTFKNRM